MSRTIWFAFFCALGLGVAVAIKATVPPAVAVAVSTADHGAIEPEAVSNQAAKSDRLELFKAPVKTEDSGPPAQVVTTEIPPAVPEITKKIPERNWRDANARLTPAESSRRPAKRNEVKKITGIPPSNARAEVWHCRRDAMGGLLRSLDLSPRCDL